MELVPLAGLEPAHLAVPDFESGASTNSATGAALRRTLSENRLPLVNGTGLLRQHMALSGPRRRAYDPRQPIQPEEFAMNEEVFNMSLRKFLKVVGVSSQQEIEKVVRDALASGKLKGKKSVAAQMVLTIGEAGLSHKVDGMIELE
jgi:hypothetical protein